MLDIVSVVEAVPAHAGSTVFVVGEAPSALALATMIEPRLSCTPPLNVFGALRITDPAPFLIRPAAASVPPITLRMVPVINRSLAELPLVVSVRLRPASSRFPTIVGVVARLSLTEVIVPLSTRVPPVVTVGVTVPPLLLKIRFASVLLPLSVRDPPPLMVTLLVLAIEALLVLWSRVAPLLIMISPGTTSAPSGTPVPPICNTPWLTTVGPV